MQTSHRYWMGLLAISLMQVACGDKDSDDDAVASGGAGGSSVGGANSQGGEQAANGGTSTTDTWPEHLLFGLFAPSTSETWMSESGAPWDVRWTYLAGQHGYNWYNSWGYGAADGAFITTWFEQCDSQGFVPAIHLYNIGYGHDQGDAGLLTEVRDPTFVADYFTEFKAMMQRAKDFDKPVLIVLEGDAFGMMEMLTGNDPAAEASVASSGLAELSGLPDTIAGIGMAYLAIRKSVGASKVLMGPDLPGYAAGGDILYGDNSELDAHRDYQLNFFSPFGLGDNATGEKFDFIASNPLAADADLYRLVYGDSNRWWDASDSAAVNSQSFNRYAAWLGMLSEATGRRVLLHQVPIGNSNCLNVASDCSEPTGTCLASTGYKDNRAEYFLNYDAPSSKAIRDAHLSKFVSSGVFAILFGGTDAGSTTAYNDVWTDGQLFLASRVTQLGSDTGGGFPLTTEP